MSSLRQRLLARLDPPRTLSFTRTGGYFVSLTLAVGVAAINTGNNLLFLLLGMLLSAIVASGILSEAVIRGLEVRRTTPARIFAGRPAAGSFVVDNPMAWPSLSVGVREAEVECRVGPQAGTSVAVEHIPWWKFWASSGDERGPVASAYCLRIDSGTSERLDARYRFGERGVYELRSLELVTRFPFSLFEKARSTSAKRTVVVYPAPSDAPDWAARLRGGIGEVATGDAGRGDEYFGLREYRPGEDKRLIHWKRSAARGELVIREHEKKTSRGLRFHLCNGVSGRADLEAREAFETSLERLAGAIRTFAANGWALGLETLDDAVPPDEIADIEALLDLLARSELREEVDGDELTPAGDRRYADVLVAFPATVSTDRDWDLVLPIEREAGQPS